MKVLVTGANGFIGSTLIERLTDTGVAVRAVVRHGLVNHRKPRRLVEPVRGDVTELDGLNAIADGCNIVYHCACGAGGSTLEEQRLVNVKGTRNVVKAAARAGVRRVVHLSSMAVHGRKLPEVLTEDFPLVTDSDPYAQSKAEGERAAFELGASTGVEIVALRPTLVYGPRAHLWLVDYFERVRREEVSLINSGNGLANLIHVEDLVDAMLAAAEKQGVGGEPFLLNGQRPITWREYLGYFAAMCGKPLPPSKPGWLARVEVPFAKVYSLLTNRAVQVSNMDLQLMTPRCAVSIAKAKRLLDYRPRISVAEGMARCEAWLRREGHLPRTPRGAGSTRHPGDQRDYTTPSAAHA